MLDQDDMIIKLFNLSIWSLINLNNDNLSSKNYKTIKWKEAQPFTSY